jgi:multicomponent Na+:H+ antiporter subunit G
MIALLVLVILGCVALGVMRFVSGPSDADRIVALDILFSAAVALCALAALYTGRVLFLDIAIGGGVDRFRRDAGLGSSGGTAPRPLSGGWIMNTVGAALLIFGALVLLLASVGLFVLRDALSRQHAATKAGSLGIVFIAAGAACTGGDWSWGWRALVIVLLVWLTMPVASHVLARAALREQMNREGVVQDEDGERAP